ncbi:MAG: fumarylacetoacetate hydrolase family protein [Paracoccaceae bacterium]
MPGLDLPRDGTFVFRIWRPEVSGPSICHLRGDRLVDITSREIPTMQALLELDDPASAARDADGQDAGALDAILANSVERPDPGRPHILAPCDLQAVKACGVTFAASMLERVIEEQARGDAGRAQAIRKRCRDILGDSLRMIEPGSDQAMQLKAALIEEGVWSQYLEVGIGPDAEVFTKCPPLASVGWGASVGLHPQSSWNNPEPELVLAVDSRGRIKGATLGNDVNLRDVEGRSALLLGKAKDNNASSALGPALRLFDDSYGLEDVSKANLHLRVRGEDGFLLEGRSSMREISRSPEDLVRQTCGTQHQYPDGFMLYLGTLFAPTQDGGEPGAGFTHKLGDRVEITDQCLGKLVNTVRLSTECPPWTFGTNALMRNLAQRGLL